MTVTSYDNDPRVEFDDSRFGPDARIRPPRVPDAPADPGLLWDKLRLGGDGVGFFVHDNDRFQQGVSVAGLQDDRLTIQSPLREEGFLYADMDTALRAVLGEPLR